MQTYFAGQQIHEWTLLKPDPAKRGKWLCQCSCGLNASRNVRDMQYGRSKSCGHARTPEIRKQEQAVARGFIYQAGMQVGFWTLIKPAFKQCRSWRWHCRCICGKEEILRPCEANTTQPSCGCKHHVRVFHGHTTNTTKTPTYSSWCGMLGRVRGNRKTQRGDYSFVQACARYNPDKGGGFANFFSDLGWKLPNYSLDRIDPNGHYSCGKCDECLANGWPMNCRWATLSEQTRNRRPHWRTLPNGTKVWWAPKEINAESPSNFTQHEHAGRSASDRGCDRQEGSVAV